MSVIKDLLLKVETLENMVKILEGKLNKLKINVDLANSKPKELPDRNTYKPQQPYMGGGGIGFNKIRESDDIPKDASENPIDIEVKVEGRVLKFINRPSYAIYYPDEE